MRKEELHPKGAPQQDQNVRRARRVRKGDELGKKDRFFIEHSFDSAVSSAAYYGQGPRLPRGLFDGGIGKMVCTGTGRLAPKAK
jgi:hypothetical protein